MSTLIMSDLIPMTTVLHRTNQENAAEDNALDRELDDLKYRVKCIQEDLDYIPGIFY